MLKLLVQVDEIGSSLFPVVGSMRAAGLNITSYSNYIYSAQAFPVNKQDALNYLDQGGSRPDRFARIIVVRGAATPPDVMEYKVHSLTKYL